MKNYLIYNLFFYLLFLSSTVSYSQVRVDISGNNTPPYTTWATAATDIQTAIDYANTNGISEVWITGETYTIPATLSLKNNLTIYGGFHVGDAILADRDWSGNPSIISGSNLRRIIFHNDDGMNDWERQTL